MNSKNRRALTDGVFNSYCILLWKLQNYSRYLLLQLLQISFTSILILNYGFYSLDKTEQKPE